MIAAEFHHQPPVCSGTTNTTTHVPQHNSAVQGVKVDLTVDISDGNPTVVSIQREVGTLRHEHLVADVPLIVLVSLRSTGKDLSAASFNPDLLAQCLSLFTRRRRCLYPGTYQYLVLIPTLNRDAAVLFAIDGDRSRRRQCLLPDLAVAHQSVVIPMVLTTE